MSALIRVIMVLLPAFVSYLAVWAAITILPAPAPLVIRIPWFALIVAVAVAGMRTADFATRQLAPLGALFRMSLVFPDAAPSRFRTALRARTGQQLIRGATDEAPTDQESAENLVTLLARLGAHDRLTRGHSERVRAYSVMLGEEIDLSPDALVKLNWAALAHDVGKLDVPPSILNKAGRPTEEEWEILRNHPAAAAKFIDSLRPWLGDWVDCATQHHERFDGTGYPAGLAGSGISLAGRIVSIADAFDVMTAARSYKRPFPPEQARAELLRNAGTQFDPGLVRSFLNISLPRQNRIAGWIGWLSNVPNMIPVPVLPAAQTIGRAVGAGAITAATIATAPVADISAEVIEFAAERTLIEEPAPDLSAPTTAPEPNDDAISTIGPEVSTSTTSVAPDTDTDTDTDTTTLPVGSTTTAPPGTPPSSTTTVGPASTTTVPGTTTTAATTTTPTTTTTTSTTTSTTTTTTQPPAVTDAVDDAQTILLVIGRTIRVLDNDDFGTSSVNLATLEVLTGPSRGTATVSADAINYVPGFLQTGGTDSFTYQVCSVAGSCDSATVVVTLLI